MASWRNLPPILRVFLLLTVVLTWSALAAPYVCSHLLHLTWLPYSQPTLDASDRFADMNMFKVRMSHFGTPSFFDVDWGSHFLYPAPNALLYRFMHFFTPHDTLAFVLLLPLTVIALGVWLLRELRRRELAPGAARLFVLLSMASSYPFFFDLERANVELFVWLFTASGVFCFLRERWWLAASLIACAGACKGYPFFFLGLFLLRGLYKQIAWSLVFGAIINVSSLWLETHSLPIAEAGTTRGLLEFKNAYVLSIRAVGLDHSPFALIKRFAPHPPTQAQLTAFLPFYLGVMGLIACVFFFGRIRKLPVLNQILFLTVAAITLPPVSFDYTLLHLYTPWVLFVFLALRAWKQNRRAVPGLWPVFLCFAVLLSSQTDFILHGERLEGAIKCLTLLTLAGLSLRFPFHYVEQREKNPDDFPQGTSGSFRRSPVAALEPIS